MKITYSRQAEKDVSALNEPMRSRIRTAIEILPAGDVKPIKGHRGHRRLRVGGYRVIFEIIDAETILIASIGPRGQIYKRGYGQ